MLQSLNPFFVLGQVCAFPPVIFEVAWSQSSTNVDQDLANWTPGNNGVMEAWAVKIFSQKLATHGANAGQWVRRMQFHRYLTNGIAQPVVRPSRCPQDTNNWFFRQIEFGSCLQGKNQVVPGPFPKTVNIPKAALFAGSAAYIADQALPAPVWSAGNITLNLTNFFNEFQAAVDTDL